MKRIKELFDKYKHLIIGLLATALMAKIYLEINLN